MRICKVLSARGWQSGDGFDIDGFAEMDLAVENDVLCFVDSDDAEEASLWVNDDKVFFLPLENLPGADSIAIEQVSPSLFDVFLYKKGEGAVGVIRTYPSLAQALTIGLGQFNYDIDHAPK